MITVLIDVEPMGIGMGMGMVIGMGMGMGMGLGMGMGAPVNERMTQIIQRMEQGLQEPAVENKDYLEF